jgi:hypothetical protein
MKLLKLLCIAFLLVSTNCKKDDDGTKTALEQLPPATQTGAQTFGCLIDGKPFIPDNFGSGRPSAFYQFVGGAYTSVIKGARRNDEPSISISIGALDIEGFSEQEYLLTIEQSENFYGLYLLDGGIVLDASTNISKPGKLNITRFDDKAFIISGTFEFTVLDNDGKEIKITDGRFDLNYTN